MTAEYNDRMDTIGHNTWRTCAFFKPWTFGQALGFRKTSQTELRVTSCKKKHPLETKRVFAIVVIQISFIDDDCGHGDHQSPHTTTHHPTPKKPVANREEPEDTDRRDQYMARLLANTESDTAEQHSLDSQHNLAMHNLACLVHHPVQEQRAYQHQ